MEYFAVVRDGTTPQGSGPITAISRWTVTRRVDAAGSWTLTMDAADAQAAQVTAKRSVDIYAYIDDGYQLVGGGIIERIERQVQQDGSEVLVVSGGDYMRELAMRTVADLETFTATEYGLWTGVTVGGATVLGLLVLSNGRVLAGTGTTTGNVYTSDDGGKTWTDRGQLGSATHVYSFTEYTGGQVVAVTANGGKVFASTNHGSTWAEWDTAGSATGLYDSALAQAGYLIVGGLNPNSTEDKTVTVFETTDFASGLTEVGSETGIAQPYPQNIKCFADGGGGLLGTADGKIWSRGVSVWEYEAAPVSGSYAIQDLEFVSDGVWWAATNYGGRIYVSSSASSWSELDQISGRTSVTALCRVSDSLAFAGADGRMYKSTDDGASWTLLQDLGAAINRIEALSDGTVLAACNDGKVYRGGTLYTAFSHEDAVDAVGALAPTDWGTWTFGEDATPENDEVFIAFAGETVLAAALRVAERSQTHCYLSTYTASARTLTYTDAWSDSGISAVTLRGGAIPDATTAAIIDLGVVSDGYDIVNRVYPYGKAADGSRFGIAETTVTETGYTVSAANNYVQHNASETAYGQIDRWMVFDDVTADSTDDPTAADALARAAIGYLADNAEPLVNYTVRLSGCSTLLAPMQTIRLHYIGEVQIDANLNILEATWAGDAVGLTTAALVVSAGKKRIQSNAETVARAIERTVRLASR